MKGLPFLLMALAITPQATAQTAAPAPAVVVQMSLVPPSGAVVGQRIGVKVDVLFEDDMPRPPRVSLPDIPGTQIFRFETQATTLQTREGGKSYVGQRFEFTLYPHRGGELTVPGAEITVLDLTGTEIARLQGPPVQTRIAVPAGVDPSGPIVATTMLALEETWQPDPASAFQPGDALTRVIKRQAEDVPGSVLSDFPVAVPEGVKAYLDPPLIEDRISRGALTGERTDRITYVFQRDGPFALPPVSQPWWDLRSARARSADGAGVSLTVAGGGPSGRQTDMLCRGGWKWLFASAGMAVALAVLAAAWLGLRLCRPQHAQPSEPKDFRALTRACRTGDATSAYRALERWRAHMPSTGRTAARIADAARPLEQAVFGDAVPWPAGQGGELADLLTTIRRSRRSTRSRQRRNPLPALNPVSPGK